MQFSSFKIGQLRIYLHVHGQRIFFMYLKQIQDTVYKDMYMKAEEVPVSH